MRSPFLIGPGPFRAPRSIILPGDKSIAHRFLIVSSLALGKTIIENFPKSEDCLATLGALRKLGVKAAFLKNKKIPSLKVWGRGPAGFKQPKGDIFVGDSGATLRLLLGVLAGQPFTVRLTAGRSLARRPMLRVTRPLRLMGAQITGQPANRPTGKQEEYPPIIIRGGNLSGITYRMPIASAQVKSAILLAGLYAGGETEVIEPVKSRDHTERALKLAGADIKTGKNRVVVRKTAKLVFPERLYVPGDISSASFFIVLAAILPHSKITIKNVSLNPSRMGVVKVLKRMGAKIQASGIRHQASGAEPMGDIIVESSKLKGTVISKEEIPSLIDELPILMVAAALAKGKTIFEDVGELRVKETDRIKSMGYNLKKMGASFKVKPLPGAENIIIQGVPGLKGAKLKSFGDHRTAMSVIVAALAAQGQATLDDVSCIAKSFPDFLPILKSLLK